jgi:exoribonuclease R
MWRLTRHCHLCNRQRDPIQYRIHENPDPGTLQNFQEFIYGFGYEFALVNERVDPKEIQGC